jgi:formylglycine-generating enzyme required for sulfatase activity
MRIFALSFFLSAAVSAAFASNIVTTGMVKVPGGQFVPFTAKAGNKPKQTETGVSDFLMDKALVTNEDYLGFVKANPDWQRRNIKPIFSDSHYLEHWTENLKVPAKQLKAPVTFVSWFAANAYCESLDKRLPTTSEWEYALYDRGRDQEKLRAKILKWYSTPNTAEAPVASSKNGYGISGLGFTVWEWTDDFNSFLLSGDSRESNSAGDSNLFCGNGSQMGDPSDYPAFMRYSFRSSLKANYTTANLGFRCAKDIDK